MQMCSCERVMDQEEERDDHQPQRVIECDDLGGFEWIVVNDILFVSTAK